MKGTKLLTVKEAASLLNVSTSTIYRMIKGGMLKARKIGKAGKTSDYRILHQSIEGYIGKAS
jgi:excisionase family DNA binding protein